MEKISKKNKSRPMKKSPRVRQCAYKLQSNPVDHWARAEDEGGDAGYNDEAVERYRQIYVFRSWKKEESKSPWVWKTSRQWRQVIRLREKKLTRAGYFPVFALVDVNIILQVNLYPAAVCVVAEGNLWTGQFWVMRGKVCILTAEHSLTRQRRRHVAVWNEGLTVTRL